MISKENFCEFLNALKLDEEKAKKYINIYQQHIFYEGNTFQVKNGYKSDPVIYVSSEGVVAYIK